MPVEDLDWALKEFRAQPRRTRYDLTRAYYLGDHRMAFAQERFDTVFGALFQTVSDNLCPAVVDSLADRLELIGFSSSDGQSKEERVNERVRTTISDPLAQRAWQIWKQNRMDIRANELHREALMTGDGYLIVWPDSTGLARMWPQVAHEITVEYDDDTPGLITRAAKLWRQKDKKMRLNLYYPDRIERFISRGKLQGYMPGSTMKGGDLDPYNDIVGTEPLPVDRLEPNVIVNPYGRVPIFHFPNKRLYAFGLSELLDVIPLQDALNKTVCDMLVAQEYTAAPQRWVAGLDVEVDESTGKTKDPGFPKGPERWVAASDANTKFGQFAPGDPRYFLEVEESLRAEIARVSGTPLHYLFITRGDFPSGEAMKSAEARFTKKIRDRQTGFGDVWEDAFAFALRIEGEVLPDPFQLAAVWENASPRSEKEVWETLQIKEGLGLPMVQWLKEGGYDDDEIDRILEDAVAAAPAGPDGQPDQQAVLDTFAADIVSRLDELKAQVNELGQADAGERPGTAEVLEAAIAALTKALAAFQITIVDGRTPPAIRHTLVKDDAGQTTGSISRPMPTP